jgi:hypothetical protein
MGGAGMCDDSVEERYCRSKKLTCLRLWPSMICHSVPASVKCRRSCQPVAARQLGSAGNGEG